eukprot:CAMPEP_0171241568 /NCGR_PEP_ID=MMETSP0790-20130122/45161_1 /TAXON_ID=2925 /ORGANISM="Alexandrium catenella, Strain OF101" /LENGTH=237 /DNA_ID=CAMNT_0011708179 /DNA_START=1 /DNA_END=711 /DNA_ORIENTATION=-
MIPKCLLLSLSSAVHARGAGDATLLRNASALLAARLRGAKDDPRWAPAAGGNASAGAQGWPAPPAPHELKGYPFLATSTRYGTNPLTSCMMDSGALVAGTDYLAVASAQAMQNMFPAGPSACCYCGSGTGGGRTVAMGCGTCGRGRFIRQLPRGFNIWTPPDAEIFHREFKVVVVDICPHGDNRMWCPPQVGHTNDFGVHNHFDFATPPPQFDNFYFAFEPAECEPQMRARIAAMSS